MPGIGDSITESWGSLNNESDFFQYLLPSSDDTQQNNTPPSSGLESIIDSSPSPSTFFDSPLSPNLSYPQM